MKVEGNVSWASVEDSTMIFEVDHTVAKTTAIWNDFGCVKLHVV